jgi:very-short-patch-repair endonuclease
MKRESQSGGAQRSGCLPAILRLFAGGGEQATQTTIEEELPYRRKDYLFSRAERSFYGVLNQAIGTDYLIFAKVRLADLLFLPRSTESRQRHQNRVNAKHVDFVLCDRDQVQPLLVIELDDSSHQRSDRQKRDKFVNRALAAASLPIMHVTVQQAYNPEGIRKVIDSMLRQGTEGTDA